MGTRRFLLIGSVDDDIALEVVSKGLLKGADGITVLGLREIEDDPPDPRHLKHLEGEVERLQRLVDTFVERDPAETLAGAVTKAEGLIVSAVKDVAGQMVAVLAPQALAMEMKKQLSGLGHRGSPPSPVPGGEPTTSDPAATPLKDPEGPPTRASGRQPA